MCRSWRLPGAGPCASAAGILPPILVLRDNGVGVSNTNANNGMIRGLATHYRKAFPDYPFSLSLCDLGQEYLGLTYKVGDKWKIELDHSFDTELQLHILIHEFAHVLSWDQVKFQSRHGVMWGRAYSKAYRSYLRWIGQE